ncbi:MAG: hypothetical protein LBQ59_00115 [Candidatus Peribacteria bacterium]|jgi:hypothetical protein|nr:hypothetical protein [Candidatus Peribacteria bacterium]
MTINYERPIMVHGDVTLGEIKKTLSGYAIAFATEEKKRFVCFFVVFGECETKKITIKIPRKS